MRFAAVDGWTRKHSILHRRDARAKIAAVLILLFAVSRGKLYAPTALIVAGVALAHLPLGALLLRACAALPFAAGFTLASAVSGRPEAGLALAIKSYVSAMCVLLLAGTTPLPSLLEGFRRFGVPAMLLEVIQFIHRYLFLAAEQGQRMAVAARSRGARRAFPAVAGSVGVLFARSYGRAEAIHRSMLARGYTGALPTPERQRFRFADAAVIGAAFAAAALAFV